MFSRDQFSQTLGLCPALKPRRPTSHGAALYLGVDRAFLFSVGCQVSDAPDVEILQEPHWGILHTLPSQGHLGGGEETQRMGDLCPDPRVRARSRSRALLQPAPAAGGRLSDGWFIDWLTSFPEISSQFANQSLEATG